MKFQAEIININTTPAVFNIWYIVGFIQYPTGL